MLRSPYGDYVTTTTAGMKVRAFVPPPLPPLPPVEWTTQLIERFNDAHAALGRLDGISSIIPSKQVFIHSYIRKEAVLSSQIEGTQSSLADLLLYETDETPNVPLDDVQEVINYVAALNHGLDRLAQGFPLSLRLIKELHGVLLSRGKYASKSPGEFRNYQNWIGGTRPSNANFVPTPPDRLMECMGKLGQFLHNDFVRTPTLLKAALTHAQFETIHPFPDGNGKIGRLMISLILSSEDLLHNPLLYLSLYFKTHRKLYYDLINKVRLDGDWESWLGFFADATAETATQAVNTAHELLNLTKRDQDTVTALGRSGSLMLVYLTFLNRLVSKAYDIGYNSGLTPATVNKCLDVLERAGIIAEITGQKRNRVFSYRTYIEILNRGLAV